MPLPEASGPEPPVHPGPAPRTRTGNDEASPRMPVDMRWGVRMAFLDNVLRGVEPLLVLGCAGVYAGGAWGSFKLAESLAYLLFRLSLMGLDRGLIWWYGQVDERSYRRDLIASIGVVLLAAFTGCAGMLLLARVAGVWVSGLELPWTDLACIAGSIPLLALAGLIYQVNINRKEMLGRILGNNILLPLVVFGGALASRLLGLPLGLPACFFLGNLANALLAATVFLRIHRFGREDLHAGPPSPALRRYGLPLLGSDLVAGLMGRIDLMMLAALADIRAVEIYNVVMMVGRSLQAIRQSFDGILLADFSREGARRLTATLRHRLNHAAWTIAMILGVALLAVVFWGRELMGLVGPQYREGHGAMILLVLMTYLNVHGDLSGLMLQGLGRSGLSMAAQIAGFTVNLVCNLWWIPLWGATGGVLALGISLLAQGLACQWLLHRDGGQDVWQGRYLRSTLLAGLALLAACIFGLRLDNLWYRGALFAAVAIAWGGAFFVLSKALRSAPPSSDAG